MTTDDRYGKRRVMSVVLGMPRTPHMASDRAFFGVAALIFMLTAAATIVWCSSMASMGGMDMPGDWTMSMMWMRMPGQTWLGVATVFLGMWIVMMIAMMLPALMPMLWRYRLVLGEAGERRLGRLTALVGVGYFFVWTLLGMCAFAVGSVLATFTMHVPALARAVPMAIGVVVVLAGLLQLTSWKAAQLACCHHLSLREQILPADVGAALRLGFRQGVRCSRCCAGLMTVLLVCGVMDLRAMILVTAATTLERIAPTGQRVAQVIGGVIIVAGVLLIGRAAGVR